MYSDDLPKCKKCTDQIEPCDTGSLCGKCSNETTAILERLEERISENDDMIKTGLWTFRMKFALHHIKRELHYIKTGKMITEEDMES